MKKLFPQIDGFIHGGDYNPEQWLDMPEILAKDIEMMKEAHVNCATLGVFSWSVLEPEEGVFNLEWLENIINNLYENGIYTILATPTGARPAWLAHKYPEVLRVASDNIRNHFGVRHNHCMQSPVYREKAEIIIRKLAERFGNHPGVILWHISNEFSGECYCDKCVAKFREWIKNKYKTLDNLNKEYWTTFWSHRYQSFDQVEPPYDNGEFSVMGLNLDWKRFTTWSMKDYMDHEINILRELTPHKPITTNYMRCFDGLDYDEMSKSLDMISWDGYPAWNNNYESLWQTAADVAFDHAQMRGYGKGKPFMLMESVPSQVNWHPINKLKRPHIHKLSCLQAVACGSDTVQYFQWRKGRGSFEQYHGAVVDHLGRNDTRVFKDVQEVGAILRELKAVQGSTIKAKAAIIFDRQNGWAIDGVSGFKLHDMGYERTCRDWHNALTKRGVEADVVGCCADLSGYSLVIAPMLYMLNDGVAEKLKNFTANGGVLAATYFTGYVNKNTLNYLGGFPGDGLKEVFGLYSEECDVLYPEERNALVMNEAEYELKDLCEVIKLDTAKSLGNYKSDFYADTPVFSVNEFGKGKAFYIASRTESKGTDAITDVLLKASGIETKELPEGVEMHIRDNGDSEYVFYLNFTDKEQKVADTVLAPYDVQVIKHSK